MDRRDLLKFLAGGVASAAAGVVVSVWPMDKGPRIGESALLEECSSIWPRWVMEGPAFDDFSPEYLAVGHPAPYTEEMPPVFLTKGEPTHSIPVPKELVDDLNGRIDLEASRREHLREIVKEIEDTCWGPTPGYAYYMMTAAGNAADFGYSGEIAYLPAPAEGLNGAVVC